jgi:hypothetical protein
MLLKVLKVFCIICLVFLVHSAWQLVPTDEDCHTDIDNKCARSEEMKKYFMLILFQLTTLVIFFISTLTERVQEYIDGTKLLPRRILR